MILVTGATGNIGRELVQQLAQAGIPARALVRNKAKAQPMFPFPSIELVEGDLGKTSSLPTALEGVERVFLLSSSDYRQVELQRNLIIAAKAAGVRHIIKLSVVGASADAPAQLMRWHAQTEHEIEQSGMEWTHLRPHVFFQIWVQLIFPIMMTGGFYASLKADVALPAIDVRDVAAVALRCLTEPGHYGKVYSLTGSEPLSNVDLTRLISRVMKRTVSYTAMSADEVRQGMLQMGMAHWFADFVVGMDDAYSNGAYSDLSYDFYKITGQQPRTAAQFFEETAAFFRNPPKMDMGAIMMGNSTPAQDVDGNKAKVIRLYDELNHNNFDVIAEVMDPHFVAHGETMGLQAGDPDHLAAVVRGIQWAKWVFPDLYVSVNDVVGEGDRVAARLTWRGTVTQEVFGVPPNGQTIEWTGMAINRFENGKIVERWFNSDELGMMRGMGMLPPAGGGAPPPAAAAPQTTMNVASPTGTQVVNSELERNKQIVRNFYEHVFNEVNVDMLKDIMADEFEDHGEALFGSPHGRTMLEGGISSFAKYIPVRSVHIEDIIAEGDMVGVLGTMTMVHSNDWLTTKSDKTLTWKGLSLFRIKDGKITDRYFNSDSLYILEQLGLYPAKKD